MPLERNLIPGNVCVTINLGMRSQQLIKKIYPKNLDVNAGSTDEWSSWQMQAQKTTRKSKQDNRHTHIHIHSHTHTVPTIAMTIELLPDKTIGNHSTLYHFPFTIQWPCIVMNAKSPEIILIGEYRLNEKGPLQVVAIVWAKSFIILFGKS